jgi:PadR family transcriptional regulator PadR
MPQPTDLLQGTLDLLILKTLALEPMHGWGLAQRIQQVSKNVFQRGQGSLYPALHRLEYKGWIQADWGESENNRRAKYFPMKSYNPSERTAEIGIRMALGAQRSQVVFLVLRDTLTLMGAGLLIGFGLTVMAQRILVHVFAAMGIGILPSLIVAALALLSAAVCAAIMPSLDLQVSTR